MKQAMIAKTNCLVFISPGVDIVILHPHRSQLQVTVSRYNLTCM